MIETQSPRSSDLPVTKVDDVALRRSVDGILSRRPSVGLAIAVVRTGSPAFFHLHGLADIPSRVPITEGTVFRIGSISKLFTAVAVMQLVERRMIDLDAPANDYLRAFRLVSADPAFRPATVRQLLTHTAGIPEIRGLGDLLHADFTPSGGRSGMPTVKAGEPRQSLAAYYHDGLRVVVEPGTAFAYSNHSFATLGQIVEDVSGQLLDRYLRDHIFEPLGMDGSSLVRSERIAANLATGYALGPRGAMPVPDREEIGGGGGAIYSTTMDMGRFARALLGGGIGERGRILQARTLADMFEPHFQTDQRLAGIGISFFRSDLRGHLVVGHDGILPGFNSALLLAPNDGVGVVAFTNGSSGAFSWLQIELHNLLRDLLGLSEHEARTAVPHHPETWAELCGRYVFAPRISDLRGRLVMGGGVEVLVRGGRPMVRVLTPVPALFRGYPLQPDDAQDPDAFRLDLSEAGIAPVRVVFARNAEGRVTAVHTDLGGQPWSLIKVNHASSRHWIEPALGALAVMGLVSAIRRRRRRIAV